MIDKTDPALPVTCQTELLSLNRSSVYYQPAPPSPTEVLIKRRIDEIYTRWPFYGSRKITIELSKEMLVNRKAVQRHMREMGISAICPGPNLSQRRQDHTIFPYLLRNVTAAYPNHVWGIEIV
jgi:putative transposase